MRFGQPGWEHGRAGLTGILFFPCPDVAKPQDTQPITGFTLGLFLLFNYLHHCRPETVNASAVLDTFWRKGAKPSQTAIQRRRQPGERPGLLLIGAGALHVEVVTHPLHRLILGTVAEEECFEHEPVVVGEQLSGGQEPRHILPSLPVTGTVDVDPIQRLRQTHLPSLQIRVAGHPVAFRCVGFL